MNLNLSNKSSQLLFIFKEYLRVSKNSSPLTVKNYASDVAQFLRWIENKTNLEFDPTAVTTATFDEYQTDKGVSARSFERHLSSLRKFFTFMAEQKIISFNPFEQAAKELIAEREKQDPWYMKEFKDYLYVFGAADLTIKNYIIDIQGFTKWCEETLQLKEDFIIDDEGLLTKITPEIIHEYKDRLLNVLKLSPNSINRKLSSIRKYFEFLEKTDLLGSNITDQTNTQTHISNISSHPSFIEAPKPEEYEATLSLSDITSLDQKSKRKYSKIPPIRLLQKVLIVPYIFAEGAIAAKIASLLPEKVAAQTAVNAAVSTIPQAIKSIPKEFYAPHLISTRNLSPMKKLIFHIKYTRPNWYKTYHSYTFTHYFHIAVLVIFASAIGFAAYNTLVLTPGRKNPTLAAGPIAPPRILSFQGRLTDSSDTPITTTTNIRFAIYDTLAATGSSLLWQEVQYAVAPDQDGVFSINLGTNTTIPQSVFAQNDTLYLGVTIENTSELTPRQRLAAVAFATNAEVLQGMPPITQVAAGTSNVILALDSSGNLTIGGSANPIFQASGGQFKLSGQPLYLTTNTGTSGNIVVHPDGLGMLDVERPIVNITSNGNLSPGAVEIQDKFAINATESAVAAFLVNNNTSGGDIIAASSSGTTKLVLSNAGNLSLVAGSTIDTLTSGTLGIGTTNATTITIGRTGQGITLPAFATNNNSVLYTGAAGALGAATTSSTGSCLVSNGAGAAPSWGTCGAAGTNWWQVTSGMLAPINSTLDFAIGGQATNSAKFAVLNVNSGITTATVAGNIIAYPQNGAGGAVGIGTLSPRYALDVVGNAIVSGNVGIGNATPGTALDVTGTGRFSTGLTLTTGALNLTATSGSVGLTLTSATSAFNINSGLFNIDTTNNRIGIGTTTPLATRLDVRGLNATTPTASISANSNYAALVIDNLGTGDLIAASGSGVKNFRVKNNGDVVVGLNGTGKLTAGVLDPYLIQNQYTSGLTSLTFQTMGASGGDFIFQNQASELVRILQNGNLGIGSAAPTQKLDVVGNVKVAGDILPDNSTRSLGSASTPWNFIYANNIVAGSTGTSGFWTQNNGLLYPANATVDFALGGTATNSAKFAVLNINSGITTATVAGNIIAYPQNGAGGSIGIGTLAPRQALDVVGNGAISGNLGIGTTTGGSQRLDVRAATPNLGRFASTGANNAYVTVDNEQGSNQSGIQFLDGGTVKFQLGKQTSNSFFMYDAANTRDFLRETTAGDTLLNPVGGNVSIGTTASTKRLTVYSTSNADGVLVDGTTSPGYALANSGTIKAYLGLATASDAWVTGSVANDTVIRSEGSNILFTTDTGSNSLLTLKSGNGNVGIGSINPQAKLDLVGSLKTSAAVTFSTFTSNGGILYTNGSGALSQVTAGTATQCLLGGTTPTFGACAAGNQNYWQLNSGAISPFTSSVDLLIGSTATTSANFAVLNNAGGTPTATVAGNFIVMPKTVAGLPVGGNVGIGTINPTKSLVLNQKSTGDGFQFTGTSIDNTNSGTGFLFALGHNATGNKQVWFGDPDGAGNASYNFMRFVISGASSLPTLDGVTGDGTARAKIQLGVAGDSNSGVYVGQVLGINGNSAIGTSYYNQSPPTNGLIVQGNVGLGTSSPATVFDVQGTFGKGNALAIFNQTQVGTNADVLTASVAGATKFVVTQSGNVGISSTLPGANLDVVGTGRFSSTLTASNALTVSAGSITFSPFTSNGGVLYTNGSGVLSQVTAGTNTQCLLGGTTPAFGSCTTGSQNYWQLISGALSPFSNAADLLIGSTATTSAKFAVLNIAGGTPRASVSGDFIVMPNSGTGTAGGGNVGIGTTAPSAGVEIKTAGGLNKPALLLSGSWLTDGSGNTVNHRPQFLISDPNVVDGFWSTSGTGLGVNGPNGFTGNLAQFNVNGTTKFTIDSTGAVTTGIWNGTVIGTQYGGLGANVSAAGAGELLYSTSSSAYGHLAAAGSSGLCLTSGGAGAPSWTNCGSAAGANLWAQNNAAGTLYPGNSTVDLLVGGTATNSAKFAVLNVAGGITTATVAGNIIAYPQNGAGGAVGIGTLSPRYALDVIGNAIFSGNVGIGSVTPGQKLDVTGSINVSSNIVSSTIRSTYYTPGTAMNFYNDFPNGYQAWSTTIGSLTERMRLDTGGNLGIGTTAPASVLEVKGTAGANAAMRVIQNSADAGADLFTASAGATTRFTIRQNGNVGIGSAIPGAALDVVGTGRFSSTLTASNAFTVSAGSITFTPFTSNGGILYTNGSGVLSQVTAGTNTQCLLGGTTPAFGSCSTGQLDQFWSQRNGTLFANNSTVDFLIGGQATNSAKFAILNVNSGITTATVAGNIIAYPQNGAGGAIGIGTLSPRYALDVIGNAIVSGNVGIGTSLPISQLANTNTNIVDAAGTGVNTGSLTWTFNNSGYAEAVYNASTASNANGLLVKGAGTATTNKLFEVDSGASQGSAGTGLFVVQGNGNVGVGSVTPGATFDVTGTGRFSSTLTASNAFTVSAGSITFTPFTSNGGPLFTNGSGVVSQVTAGSATQCLLGGTTPTFGSCGTGTGANLWSQNNAQGTIYPGNSTVDLLIGGTATNSAKFAVLNVAGGITTATVAGNIIAYPQNGAGGAVGIGTLSPRYALDVVGNGIFSGNVGIGTTNTSQTLYVNGNTNIVGTNNDASVITPALNINGAFITIGDGVTAGTLTNGVGIKFFDSGVAHASIKYLSSASRMDFCNSSAGNSLTCNTGTETLSLKLDNKYVGIGSTSPTSVLDVEGTNGQGNALAIFNQTQLGTGSDILTASSAGVPKFVINRSGNVGIGSNAFTTTPNLLFVSGTTTGNAVAIFDQRTASSDIFAASASGTTKFQLTNGGSLNLAGGQTSDIDALTATTLKIGASTATGITIGRTSQTITLPTFTSNGGVLYTNGSGQLAQVTAGSASQCLLGGTTPTFGACGGSIDVFWNQTSGALYPNNSTVDLLIGAQATTSAKFAVLNVANGTPVASVSSGLSGTALSFDAAGNIQTSNNMTLTVGGNTTGQLALAEPFMSLNSNKEASISAWTVLPSPSTLPIPKRLAAAVSANGYIYHIGGYDTAGNPTNTVSYARANADGTLNGWRQTTVLPATLGFLNAVTTNGYVYVMGGATPSVVATVYYSKINPDGTLGAWQTGTPLPAGRRYASTAAINGYIYYFGGYDSSIVEQTTVYYARANADGTVGAWQTGKPLPAARTGSAAVVANGYVYVIGGTSANTVYYATIFPNGTLGDWTTNATNLPANSDGTTAITSNGYIYVVGGGSTARSTVYYGKVNNDGSVTKWDTSVNFLPTTQQQQSLVMVNGYMYSMGGMDAASVIRNVVFSSSLPRVSLASNLDLLGLTSLNLSSASGDLSQGSSGGSIFAGNIFSAGMLEVNGMSRFWSPVAINGNLSLVGNTVESAPLLFAEANTQNKALAIFNQLSNTADILTASSSGTTQLYLTNGGTLTTRAFSDLDDSTYFLDPAATGNSMIVAGNVGIGVKYAGNPLASTSPLAKLHVYSNLGTAPAASISARTSFAALLVTNDGAGPVIAASSSGKIVFEVRSNGDTLLANGTGKIYAAGLDPRYTIDGKRYSTFAPSMSGMKEEITGAVNTSYDAGLQAYAYTMDFNHFTKDSDLWVYSRVIDPNISMVTALLSSSSNARTWYTKDPVSRKITFYSDIPTQITYRLTAPRFDYKKWPTIATDDDTVEGLIAPPPPSPVGTVSSDPNSVNSAFNTQMQIQKRYNSAGQPFYALVDGFGNVIKRADSFSSLIAANIKAGLVSAQEGAFDNLSVGGKSIRDFIVDVIHDTNRGTTVASPLTSADKLSTDIVSPLDNSDVSLKLKDGKLEVNNKNDASGSAVLTIDNKGNLTTQGDLSATDATISGSLSAADASISGTLTTTNLNATDATISGTLHAGSIDAGAINGLDEKIKAQMNTVNTATTAGNLTMLPGGNVDISNLSANFALIHEDLISLGTASFNEASVMDQLSIGTTLTLSNNTINTLGSDLEINPLRQGNVTFLGGLIKMDTEGNLEVQGNASFAKDVRVNGSLTAGLISPLAEGNLIISLNSINNPSQQFEIHNASDSAVFAVNQQGDVRSSGDLIASGAATFAKLNLKFADQAYATSETTAVATGSAGMATLKANKSELTIVNKNVTEKSLIYITPVGATTKVISLLRQVGENASQNQTGSFTVGVSSATTADIKFNWIIVN